MDSFFLLIGLLVLIIAVVGLLVSGHDRALVLSVRPLRIRIEKATLERPIQEALKRLLASKAVEKFKNGRSSEITFYDACAFWGISPSSSAIELSGQLSNFNRIVQAAQDSMQDRQVTFGHGGYAFGPDALWVLQEVHAHLQETFSGELILQRDFSIFAAGSVGDVYGGIGRLRSSVVEDGGPGRWPRADRSGDAGARR